MQEIKSITINYKEEDILTVIQKRTPRYWESRNVKLNFKPVLGLAIIATFCLSKLHSDYATGYVVGLSTSVVITAFIGVHLLIEWWRHSSDIRHYRAYARGKEGKQLKLEFNDVYITAFSNSSKESHEWTEIIYAAINHDFILLDFNGPQQIYPSISMSTSDFQLFYETVQNKIPHATVTP